MIDTLIDEKDKVGVFRGFTESNLEFHADLILPYNYHLNNVPLRGQFLLIQLDSPDEALLGRITSVSSDGKLSYGAGEEYSVRAVKEGRPIPEDLKENFVRYLVNVRVLGNIRLNDGKVLFAPSHRRLPHVGSPVAFPSDSLLKQIVTKSGTDSVIGHYALGEYIYSGTKNKLPGKKDWMRVMDPELPVNFSVEHLVAKRSFIFARAGFGKSNLNKLLFKRLYSSKHTVKKGKKEAPVGTLIFDRDGEYYWPDVNGRPGLCDVKELINELVVFTNKEAPSDYYGSFVAGGIRIDIRDFLPSEIIPYALSKEKQEQQNVKKLLGLNVENWRELVNIIDQDHNNADLDTISGLIGVDPNSSSQVEATAARSHMSHIVRMLHDSRSLLKHQLLQSLRDGKLCIIDTSKLGGEQALIISGIILKMVFKNNQEEFTKKDSKTIPTIVVLEEAQSVLIPDLPAAEPFISWVKEGRKYDLGALMITQQPGSIPTEILSQGDNWFIFHLLSATDLQNVKRANAHFSEDILGTLLNEPIIGQCVFWSSAIEMSYPISIRVSSFEDGLSLADGDYNRPRVDTYVNILRQKTGGEIFIEAIIASEMGNDKEKIILNNALKKYRGDEEYINRLKSGNTKYGWVMEHMKEFLPDAMKEETKFNLVNRFLDELLGKGKWDPKKFVKPGDSTAYVVWYGESNSDKSES